jgi:hypothetical protein
VDDAVEGQLRAYNEHDADKFAECYAENVVIEDASRHVLMDGREQVRERYRSFFQKAPSVHAEVVTRIRLRSYVIDEERATNSPSGDVHAVVIYRIGPDGLIDHVLFLG